jgi:hypothetical protein
MFGEQYKLCVVVFKRKNVVMVMEIAVHGLLCASQKTRRVDHPSRRFAKKKTLYRNRFASPVIFQNSWLPALRTDEDFSVCAVEDLTA